MFERLTDEGLAQTSYVIACPRTRAALVIDPRRDIDAYTSLAAAHGLRLALAAMSDPVRRVVRRPAMRVLREE